MWANNLGIKKLLGSHWSGYVPLWIIAVIIWSLNSIIFFGFAVQHNSFGAAVTGNILSGAVIIGIAFLWRLLIQTRWQQSLVPVWAVILAGGIVGILKGIVTNAVVWALVGTTFDVFQLMLSSIPAFLTGLWLIPSFAIIGAMKEKYEQQRQILLGERVAQHLNTAFNTFEDEDISRFISRARLQLDNADTPTKFRHALHNLAEEEVRPISHKLWQVQQTEVTGFTFKDLAVSTILRHRFPALGVSFTLFVCLLMLYFPLLRPGDAILRSVIKALIAGLVLTIGRLIPLHGKVTGSLVFFGTPLVAVIAIDVLTQAFTAPLTRLDGFLSETILYFALTETLLIFGAVAAARHSHFEIREQISVLRNQIDSQEAHNILRQIQQRETAELLHGYVQNQLLTNALRLTENPQSLTQVKTTIGKMLDEIEKGTLVGAEKNTTQFDQTLKEISQMWHGFIDVSFTIVGTESKNLSNVLYLDRIINELVANSFRHGNASQIHVKIHTSAHELRMTAEDNGIGIQPGKPGLGTALITTITGGQWSRANRHDHPGVLVTCTLSSTISELAN